METQKAQFSETALQSARAYNNVTKKTGFYGVPIRAAVVPIHIWRPLVEKAGLKIQDIPKTWDAYFDFFKKVQDKLRKQGERKVYGLGFQVTANGVDPYNLFMAFLVAYGGQDIVTPDGKLHLDDPKVKQAAIKAAAYLGGAYRDGYVPPSAINWNDADDNNAFHAQLMVMDVDGTLSTEVAVKEKHPEWYFKEMVTQGFGYPNDNAGKPVPNIVGITSGWSRKGPRTSPWPRNSSSTSSSRKSSASSSSWGWAAGCRSCRHSPRARSGRTRRTRICGATSSRVFSTRPCRTPTCSTWPWRKSATSTCGAWR